MCAAAVIAIVATLIPVSAGARRDKADDPVTAKAKVLSQSGTAHYNLGEWKEALADYREAYRLKPEPAFLYNIGQAARQAGDPDAAIVAYRSFLRARPDDPHRGDVEQFIAQAEVAIAAREAAARQPPQGTRAPDNEGAATPAQSNVPIAATTATAATKSGVKDEPRRVKPWVWVVTGVGAAIVVGGAVGLGIGLSNRSAEPSTEFGTIGGL